MFEVSIPLECLFEELHFGIKIKFTGCSILKLEYFLVKPPEIHNSPQGETTPETTEI